MKQVQITLQKISPVRHNSESDDTLDIKLLSHQYEVSYKLTITKDKI